MEWARVRAFTHVVGRDMFLTLPCSFWHVVRHRVFHKTAKNNKFKVFLFKRDFFESNGVTEPVGKSCVFLVLWGTQSYGGLCGCIT